MKAPQTTRASTFFAYLNGSAVPSELDRYSDVDLTIIGENPPNSCELDALLTEYSIELSARIRDILHIDEHTLDKLFSSGADIAWRLKVASVPLTEHAPTVTDNHPADLPYLRYIDDGATLAAVAVDHAFGDPASIVVPFEALTAYTGLRRMFIALSGPTPDPRCFMRRAPFLVPTTWGSFPLSHNELDMLSSVARYARLGETPRLNSYDQLFHIFTKLEPWLRNAIELSRSSRSEEAPLSTFGPQLQSYSLPFIRVLFREIQEGFPTSYPLYTLTPAAVGRWKSEVEELYGSSTAKKLLVIASLQSRLNLLNLIERSNGIYLQQEIRDLLINVLNKTVHIANLTLEQICM